MTNLLVKQLIEFGLSEKEAKIYLALLELEVAAVSEIAKTANINRSSTYVVLSSLKKKGLVSMSEGESVERYMAITPEMLLHEAKDRAQKAEDIKSKISELVPELKAMHKDTKHRPKIRIFEGKDGLIAAFEDSLDNKEKVMRVASSGENIVRNLPDYFMTYLQKRATLGIKMYGIHPNDEYGKNITKFSPKIDRSMLISPKKYKMPVDMAIWDNKVGYMSFEKEGFAIGIESKEIAEVMKSVFDLAFEEARRLNKAARHKK